MAFYKRMGDRTFISDYKRIVSGWEIPGFPVLKLPIENDVIPVIMIIGNRKHQEGKGKMDTRITVIEPKNITQGNDLQGFIQSWHDNLDLRMDSGELSSSTDDGYKIGFRRFMEWVQENNVNGINPDIIREYKAGLLKKGYKPGSVNTWLAGVRDFFNYAMSQGLITYNPTNGIKGAARNGTTKKHKRDLLTDQEVRRLLAIPDTSTDQGKRDLAILKLFAYTGIRQVELYRADLADLRTESNRMRLYVQGKGRSESDEWVTVPEAAAAAVYDWLAIRGNKPGALFVSMSDRSRGKRLSLRAIRHIVKDTYRKAGITGERKTTHSLRHTAATAAIKGGATPLQVKSMLRHKSLDTTMIYYHEFDRMTDPAENHISYGEGIENGQGGNNGI